LGGKKGEVAHVSMKVPKEKTLHLIGGARQSRYAQKLSGIFHIKNGLMEVGLPALAPKEANGNDE